MNTPSIAQTPAPVNRPRAYLVARLYGPVLPCPACQATVQYSGGARTVTCHNPACHLTLTLTRQENSDLTDAVTGVCRDVPVADLLAAIYQRRA